MNATRKPVTELTAEDVMTGDVVCLADDMPLRQAARLLIKNQIGGAPVVDSEGRCIGVLSAIDFLRLAERRADVTKPAAPPVADRVQLSNEASDGRWTGRDPVFASVGSLPHSVPAAWEPDGEELLVCSQAHCVLADWQNVEMEKLPTDEVRQFMTSDPVTVTPETTLRTLARMMIDAHIHRVIVVDEKRKPLGVVSSTDLLAVLASDHEP